MAPVFPRFGASGNPGAIQYCFALIDGLMYVRARLTKGGQPRTFAAHLISQVRALDETFRRRTLPQTSFKVFDGRPEKVEVRFHPIVAPYIREKIWHKTQKLSEDAAGWLTFRARLSGMHEFVGWVMSWGERAELVQPQIWRDEIRRRSSALTNIHEQQNDQHNDTPRQTSKANKATRHLRRRPPQNT